MTDKNKYRLRNAIKQLPLSSAPDRVWSAIKLHLDSQHESGREHFDKAKSQFQATKLKAPDIWEEIASRLSEENEKSEDNLQKAILDLPKNELPVDIFGETIEAISKEKSLNWYQQPMVKWAAAVVLVMIVGWAMTDSYFESSTQPTESITYTEEIADTEEDIMSILVGFQKEDEVMALVESTCLPLEIKCENPEFQGLLTQYKELEGVKENLIAEIKVHQDQSQLVDYLVRVEKEKTEIGKKLIYYLLS